LGALRGLGAVLADNEDLAAIAFDAAVPTLLDTLLYRLRLPADLLVEHAVQFLLLS
jgi:hypothetical protein